MCFCWHLVNRTNIINMQYAQVASILFGHGSRLDWLDTQELHKNSFLSRSQSRSSRSSLLPSPRLLYNSPGALLSKTSTLEISLPNTLKTKSRKTSLRSTLKPSEANAPFLICSTTALQSTPRWASSLRFSATITSHETRRERSSRLVAAEAPKTLAVS